MKWLRRHSDIAPRFFAEFAVGTGVSSLALFAIGGIAGLGELGRLRAGEIAVGPLNVLFAGVGLVRRPRASGCCISRPRRLLLGCRGLSLSVTAGVLAWGRRCFVLTWRYRRGSAAGQLGRRAILAAASSGWTDRLWLQFRCPDRTSFPGAARRSLRARCIDGSLTLFFGPAGAYLAGAKGVAWGYAVVGCLRGLNAWWSSPEHSASTNVEAKRNVIEATSRPFGGPSARTESCQTSMNLRMVHYYPRAWVGDGGCTSAVRGWASALAEAELT